MERSPELTPRQQEIVALVADGETNSEIGRALGISAQTVKNHITMIFARLGADSRVQVAVWWETGRLPGVIRA